MKLIDLRSDTVTKPDKNIIEEALQAELGDDEYGEDPTVNNLQEKCAELLGFESGLFVSSGLKTILGKTFKASPLLKIHSK